MKMMCTTVSVGLDLGDRNSQFAVLPPISEGGEVIKRGRCATTRRGLRKVFEGRAATRVVLEVGTHSPWVSRLLEELGHEVIVANPRKVRLISANDSKDDDVDAELLARLGRVDPKLLSPIQHRGEDAQADLAVIRSRSELVDARVMLINHVRGAVKSSGERLPSCSTDAFATKMAPLIPEKLRPALTPVLACIAQLTAEIKKATKKVEIEMMERYPDAELLRQVDGVGPITAIAFILTLEDPTRFKKSRKAGAYLGLRPAKKKSGKQDPELRITKAGNTYLRRLLINCAHYILGPFGKDSDLRDWGLHLASRGKKNAKKRAVVATARKLAVLLHRLWTTGEKYQAIGYHSGIAAV
jgi:transposase